MKKSLKLFFILIIALSINSIFAQQWSAEQKDVWASVEKYWEISSNGDAEGFLSYFDDSYIGWSNRGAFPNDKASTSKFIRWEMKNSQTLLYSITPASIWVKGDFAFTHYFFTVLEKNKDGKEEWSSGRWTDVLMKKGDKWVLVGDHGGKKQSSDD